MLELVPTTDLLVMKILTKMKKSQDPVPPTSVASSESNADSILNAENQLEQIPQLSLVMQA